METRPNAKFCHLNFRSYFEADGPNRFNFLCRIMLPAKFFVKTFFWSCLLQFCFVAVLLLGNCGRQNRDNYIERNIMVNASFHSALKFAAR